jgi:hypothetical protein
MQVLGEGLAGVGLNCLLVLRDDGGPGLGVEFRVGTQGVQVLVVVEDVFEDAVIDAEDNARIHLDEAAVAVVSKAGIARYFGETQNGLVVQAEVEDGVHHARHRGARAGSYRDEQRVFGIAEGFANGATHGG